MTAVIHFVPDLVLIKNIMRWQVLTETVIGAKHFTRISNDGSYIRVSLDVRCGFGAQYSLKALNLLEGTSVHPDFQKFGVWSAVMEWN